MPKRFQAIHAGLALLLLNGALGLLQVPYAAESLIGSGALALVLLVRHIVVRARARASYARDDSAGADASPGSWHNDIFWWSASASHAGHDSGGDDRDRKPHADAESSGGFFSSFFGDSSGSSDSGSSDSGSSDSGSSSSDAGSSDSGSSSSSFD